MATDLALTLVPPQITRLIAKCHARRGTEYADLLFFLPAVLLGRYHDFGDPTWQEFGADAGAMVSYYPGGFESEYHLQLGRVFWGLDYLLSGGEGTFFREGRVYDYIRGGQGHPYILWNEELITRKHNQLEVRSPTELLGALDPLRMEREVPKFHDTEQYRQQLVTTLLAVTQVLTTARQEKLWVAVQYT